jgi:hypothetical protein
LHEELVFTYAQIADVTLTHPVEQNPVKPGSGALSGREGEGFNNTDNRGVQTDNSNKPSPSLKRAKFLTVPQRSLDTSDR